MKEKDVDDFLDHFKQKIKIWGIIYRDGRPKNLQTLLDMGINPSRRTEILLDLAVPDYKEGPVKDVIFSGADMWVFGKEIVTKSMGKIELYIKITLGSPSRQAICISFHVAEAPISYPFKK